MAKKIYYRHGPLSVSGKFLKARNRSIQLSTLESVEITRHLFWIVLAFAGGIVGFCLEFIDLLYIHEIAIGLLLGLSALLISWQVGTLRVHSKLTGSKGWSVTWWHKPLREMREAVETALSDKGTRTYRHGGAVNVDDDGDEDE